MHMPYEKSASWHKTLWQLDLRLHSVTYRSLSIDIQTSSHSTSTSIIIIIIIIIISLLSQIGESKLTGWLIAERRRLAADCQSGWVICSHRSSAVLPFLSRAFCNTITRHWMAFTSTVQKQTSPHAAKMQTKADVRQQNKMYLTTLLLLLKDKLAIAVNDLSKKIIITFACTNFVHSSTCCQ